MKKSFLMIFCFVASFAFPQYSFDYKFLVKDSNRKKNNKDFFDTEILINTKNPNYFLYHYKNDDEIRLFDYHKQITIYFLDKSKNNEIIYNYLNYGSFVERESREAEFIEVEEVENDTFTIRTFESQKDKANFEVKVKLQKAETDLLHFYKLDLGNITVQKILKAFRERLIHLKGNSNFIITSLKIDYKNGYNRPIVKLVAYERINRVVK